MSYSSAKSKGNPWALLGAVLIGFFLADVVTVIRWAPSLLQPSHWSSLGLLLASGLVLYAVISLYFLGFYVILWILSRLLRLKFTTGAIALITALLAPIFLVVQDILQRKMLGIYVSLRSPSFYVPTGIVVGMLVLALVLIYLLTRYWREFPARLRLVFRWPNLIGVAFVVFIVYTLLAVPRINVLGLFTNEEERLLRDENKPAATERTAAKGPNFIVLKIEAFRSDEFKPENAPFLWQLAQQNVWFADYYVVSPATVPSVTSFFTSLYPAQHRCYVQALSRGVEGGATKFTRWKVASTIQALPMLLQEQGYRTLMVTSNSSTADRMFGFEDIYYRFNAADPYSFQFPSLDPFVGFHFLKKCLSRWRVLKVVVTSPEHSCTYFDAPRVNATIKRELNKKLAGEDDRPFFLYVHYIEPHTPYYLHPYRAMQINLYSPQYREDILEAYRSEIRAIDEGIADIYAYLKENGLLDNTYLFISADHGEEFYDHKQWGHGKSLYPEVLRVPAILVLPPERNVSRRVDAVVENIDVMPTLAELGGIPAPHYWEGRSLTSFFSPERKVTGGTDAAGSKTHVAFSQFNDERLHYWTSAMINGWQIIFREPTRQEGSLDDDRNERRKIMLFHLLNDPLAQDNLYGRGMDVEAELMALLNGTVERLEATADIFCREEEEIDPKLLEELRTLGYIE